MLFFAGLLSAFGILIVLFKFGVKRVIGFDLPLDIAITAFLLFSFAGTFSGMMTAMIGGIIVSLVLLAMRKTVQYERPTVIWTKRKFLRYIKLSTPRIGWVTVNGKQGDQEWV